MAKPLARSVLIAASLFGVASSVTAQSPADTFRDAVRKLRATEVDAALQMLQSLDADAISSEDATAIWKAAGEADFQILMGEGGEFASIANALLRRARPATVERSQDEAGIREAVALAVSNSTEEHSEGLRRIRANYGEFAVPALLGLASDPNAGRKSDLAIATLIRLGNEAVPALSASLQSSDLRTRSAAILALGQIGDRRAAPALASVVSADESQTLQVAARRALANMGVEGGNAAELHLAAARESLNLDVEQLIPSPVVWSLEDNALVAREVPAELYYSEVAKDHALQALALRPGSEPALQMLEATYSSQLAQVDDVSLDGDDVDSLRSAAFALGVAQADAMSVAADVDTARASTGQKLAEKSVGELNSYLSSPSIVDRYGAATLLPFAIESADEVSDHDSLVDALTRAVQQESVHSVLIIDPSQGVRELAAAACDVRGLQLTLAADEIGAVEALNRNRLIDLVLVSADTEKAATVARFCRNAGARNVAIHTLLELSEDATAEFEASELDIVEVPSDVNAESFRALLTDTLGDFDEARQVPDNFALAAAAAIERAGSAGVDMTAAGDAVARQLDRRPEIATQMALALGHAGSARHVPTLVGLATAGEETPTNLRQAATQAVGLILERSGDSEAAGLAAQPLLSIAENGDFDLELRQAAATALGRAPLNAEWRVRVASALDATAGSR
ncbi:MAG: HEAT repeat domain-containing protein [Planctomycetota bacterium]